MRITSPGPSSAKSSNDNRTKTESQRLSKPYSLERLEDRLTPSATAFEIRDALDLPDNVDVSFNGNSQTILANKRNSTGALLGFPTGKDSDFLMLSTGVASEIDTVANTSGSQGTDLGASGEAGDTSQLSFTISVPASASPQKFKLDFMFLSEEFPEYVGSQFNDFFECKVNGTEIALDQLGQPININNVFFSSTDTTGTFFDGRTVLLSGAYQVPTNTSALDIVIRIGDVGDGRYDSAVLLDNARFETRQTVYLDFNGETVNDFFFPGTSITFDAFHASDVTSNDSTQTVIDTVAQKVRSLYSSFDIEFTTTQPTSGDYMHVVIGSDNDVPVSISNPILLNFLPATTTFRQLFPILNHGDELGTLFGQADDIDFGNKNRRDRAIIFAGVFDDYYAPEPAATIIDRLAVTISHEVGHNLGARHILNDNNDLSIMKQNSPRSPSATFRNELLPLAETAPGQWADNAVNENTFAYLNSVLGPSSGASQLVPVFQTQPYVYFTFTLPASTPNLFNITIGIAGGAPDGTSGLGDSGPMLFNIPQASGQVIIALPNIFKAPDFFFMGSTTAGGPANVFSGQQSGGGLGVDNLFVPLYNQDGTPNNNIPVSMGVPGTLTNAGTASLAAASIPAASNVIDVPSSLQMAPNTTLVLNTQSGKGINIGSQFASTTPIVITLSTSNGAMTLATTSGLTFTSGDGNSDGSMTFQGTIAAVNAALNGMTFTPTNGFTGTAAISIVTNDVGNSPVGNNLDDSEVLPVNVSNVIVGPLNIAGTAGNDNIIVKPVAGSTTNVIVIVNGQTLGAYTPSGAISLDGGAGNDLITVDGTLTIPLSVTAGDGDDTVIGGNANDTMFGGLGNDVLTGGLGNDLMFGQDGDDSLQGQAGNDSFDGGNGNDTADGGDGDDLMFGQAGADSLIGGNGNDGINGGSENDTVLGQAGIDYIEGGDGNDSLLGGDDQDGFDAGAGNDFVDGGLGNDFMYGFAGNDTMQGGDGNDGIDAGDGADFVDAGFGNDFMYGLGGNDTLIGNDGNDGIDGGLGDDSLVGGNGDDLLFGAAGNDSINGGAGNDSLDGNAGNDTMDGSTDNDLIFASGGGIDIIRGGAGNDTLQNIDSAATIFGGAGNDIIYGANFTNDSLLGEDGNDAIFGLSGNDTISTGNGSDTVDGGAGTDFVTDAVAGDVLVNIP